MPFLSPPFPTVISIPSAVQTCPVFKYNVWLRNCYIYFTVTASSVKILSEMPAHARRAFEGIYQVLKSDPVFFLFYLLKCSQTLCEWQFVHHLLLYQHNFWSILSSFICPKYSSHHLLVVLFWMETKHRKRNIKGNGERERGREGSGGNSVIVGTCGLRGEEVSHWAISKHLSWWSSSWSLFSFPLFSLLQPFLSAHKPPASVSSGWSSCFSKVLAKV